MALSSITDTPCLLFAYHELGYACTKTLLEMGAPIAALFTHQDDPGEEIFWRSCSELARKHGIPVRTDEQLDAAAKEWVGRLAPAIIYSFAYRRLLPADLLALAPLGAYNMHPSKLPAYRGRAPVNWVLVNGEHETGITLHHMVARADAGDIVGQRRVVIDDADTAPILYRRLVEAGVEMLRQLHPLIVSGQAPRIRQDLTAGSYFGRRRPADGRIDWRWSARRIHNLIRAVTHPYPGAFCYAEGRKLFLWQARIEREHEVVGAPGRIVGPIAGEGMEVAAGEGSLGLLRVQYEGEDEASAERVLGSNRVAGAWALS